MADKLKESQSLAKQALRLEAEGDTEGARRAWRSAYFALQESFDTLPYTGRAHGDPMRWPAQA